MKNKILLWVVPFAIIVFVIAAFRYSAQDDSLRIGGLFPLTGGLASYGEPAHNAALLAVEDINAEGGINGKRLDLISEDHKCDPKIAASAYQKLVNSDGVHILTAVACSGTVSAIAPSLAQDDAVLMGTVTSADKLTGISPNFFRNWASDGQEARLLADRAIAQGYKNIAVIYEETDYAKGLKISLEKDLAATGINVISESFASGSTDVRTQLVKLRGTNPDAVFVSVQTIPSGETVLSQMEQMGFVPKHMFINDNILKAPALLSKHSKLLEGAVGGDYVFRENSRLNKILSEYKTRFGNDCPQINICAAEYDAVQLIADGIRSGGTSMESMRSYLRTVKYAGASGDIAFDQTNNRSGASYSLFMVRNATASQI